MLSATEHLETHEIPSYGRLAVRGDFCCYAAAAYAGGMDHLGFGVQPHCPNDDVVMRDVAGGWECPECGHVEQAMSGPLPPEFDGPSIHGG